MAFNDILQALATATDAQIAAARTAKQESIAHTREQLDRDTSEKLAFFVSECERKKKNMERQIKAHTQMQGRQAAMTAKHLLMEQVYARVLQQLETMDAARTESFLRRLVEVCPSGGTIRPAKAHAAILQKIAGNRTIGESITASGGFIYESETSERHCTYDVLVRDILRPATELTVASTLFQSA